MILQDKLKTKPCCLLQPILTPLHVHIFVILYPLGSMCCLYFVAFEYDLICGIPLKEYDFIYGSPLKLY